MIKSKEGRTKGRIKVVEAINNEIPEVAVARDNDQLRRQDYLKLHYSITAAATTNCTGVEVPQYTYADIEVICTDDFPLANNTHLEKPIEFFKQVQPNRCSRLYSAATVSSLANMLHRRWVCSQS